MPFKDNKEGQTHHNGDACLKCKHCGSHYYCENFLYRHHCDIRVDNYKKKQKTPSRTVSDNLPTHGRRIV